jgi:TctA family transporter
VIKGLIAAGIGLLLSTVGLDPQQGTQRFTFDQLFLWDGVGLVPVALGLFAIPEIVDLGRKGTSIAGQAVGKSSGVLQGVGDVFRHFWLTVRCSIIGTTLGAIPGMGGSVGQWIAYGHAYHSSKNKEQFGKGAIEGVIGPGAANNSKEAGALVPIIAFGIPTGLSTAILLGAFLIHGLEPGPKMLTEQLPITMSFVWVMVLSNLIAVSICLMFLRQIAMLTFIRAGIILPVIILLVLIGVFAENNSLIDLLVLLVAGTLGIAMVELNWPRAPLILGMVLGRLIEVYLFKSINLYGYDWLTRPIVMVLFAIGLIVMLLPLLQPMLAKAISRNSGINPSIDVFKSDDA